MLTTTEPGRRVRVVVVETGETYCTTWAPNTPRDADDFRGWLLRTRAAYRRRTGHHLRVEDMDR